MTTISLPTNPTVGVQYTLSNGVTYFWDGQKWQSESTIISTISSSSGLAINIDGGTSNSVYTIDQYLDGGGA